MSKQDFIYQTYIDPSICDKLIALFKLHPHKHPGMISSDGIINRDYKASTDLALNLNQTGQMTNPRTPPSAKLLNQYSQMLQECLVEYTKKFPYSDKIHHYFQVRESVNIQHYAPGESYAGWHCERQSPGENSRHLVFMTYLNTVKVGGETEWHHQKLKIKPKKGMTVIWPTDWTHVHRGCPAPKEDKYILTGWWSYMPMTTARPPQDQTITKKWK